MTKFTRSIATTMAASLMFFGYQGAAVAGVAVGDTVTCTSLGGFGCSAGSAVVGAGPEFIIDNNYMSMDFTTNQLTVLALRNFTLGLTVIQFGNTTDPFTGFTFASQNGFRLRTQVEGGTVTMNVTVEDDVITKIDYSFLQTEQ